MTSIEAITAAADMHLTGNLGANAAAAGIATITFADTGDDEFVVGDAAEPTTSTASDADSFVIGDQAAVDQFVASDPADEFTIADDTAPVAPSFDGQEDTTDFQIGDDSVTPTVTEAETPEATTVDEDQFSVSDIPVDPGTNTLVEDQPPVNLADDVALDAPGQLSLTEEPDLSPLPLPEANSTFHDYPSSLLKSKHCAIDHSRPFLIFKATGGLSPPDLLL